ncbi:hypothetical protein K435DRAFT_620104, partial [Dendrothele bispora CBS 962.96]
QKFSTRLQICATMTDHLRGTGDEEGLRFWAAALTTIDRLTIDGMSEDETVELDGEKVMVVKDLAFRHPNFNRLFEHIDATRPGMKSLFNQGGRKRIRRVLSKQLMERKPPPGLPSSFYRPEYLNSMKGGLVPWVGINENE